MNKLHKLLFLSLIFVGLFKINVNADSFMPPEYYEVQSEDGQHVFKFIPKANDAFSVEAGVDEGDQLIYSLPDIEPIGTPKYNLFFSKDMKHAAWLPIANQEVAINFYTNGNRTKQIRIDELVDNMDKVSMSVSMAFWRAEDEPLSFDSDGNRLSVKTVENKTYVFDITNGEIVEKSGFRISWILFSLGIVTVGGVVLLALSHRKKKGIE